MRNVHALIIITVVVLLVFCQTLSGDFLAFDDELLILDNPTVHGLTTHNVAEAFTTYDPELYIPLTLFTHQVEWSLVGDSPLLYHITNLLLHLLSVAFVFLIFRRFFAGNTALICALLFALHPIQVESVAWISGRKDLLASMFFLASTYSYLQWKGSGDFKLKSIVLFLCGLLSKVSIFPLPFCLLLLDSLRGDKITRELVQEKIPYFALSLLFLVIAFIGKSAQASDPFTEIILAPASLLVTLKHIVYPLELTIFYPFTELATLANPKVFTGIAILVLMSISTFAYRKKSCFPLISFLWLLILISPSFLNMQQGGELGIADIYLTSDRYAYLALLGPIFLVGYLLTKYSRSTGFIIVVIFAAISFQQVGHWNNSIALFQRVIDVGQPSHVAFTNNGGYAAQAGDLEQAERLYEQSLAIRTTTRALYNLAQIKAHLGKKQEAIDLYRKLLELSPGDSEARSKLNALL